MGLMQCLVAIGLLCSNKP